MIQYVEKDTAKILEESEMNAKEELEEETETVSTIAYAKISYSKQLVTKFYGHKLRDFSSKKVKQWQKVDNVKSLIEESRFDLYNMLRNRTKGGVLDEVRRLRDKNVEHTRGKIAELFGMETYDDNKQLEEQLSKGIVNTQTDSDGNITYIPMKLKDNLVTWFKDLEKLRDRIMQRLPDGMDKNEYELTKWSTMILHVREGIHQSYRSTITQMCLIRSVSTKSSMKGSNEAAPLMDVEQDYKLLDYFEMKRALLRDWKDKLETWKSSNSSNVPTLAMGLDSC